MGAFIIMGIFIAVAIAFPPLALIIIPFIIISILVGYGIRILANAFSEPTRQEIAQGSERIAQSIDMLNKERWAAQFDDVEIDEEGNLRVIEEEEEEEVVAPAPRKTPKRSTKKKSKPRARKKKDKLPNAKDLIEDIEKELFGETK